MRAARRGLGGAFALLMAVVLATTGAPAFAAEPPTPSPGPPRPSPLEGTEQVLGQLRPAQAVGPGVTHREFTTTAAAGQVMGDVVEVDLTQPGVRVDEMGAGSIAGRKSIAAMANDSGAVAGINGDFFDIGRTSAPAGPAVRDGRALKAPVPQGRRAAPAVPGAEMDYAYTVGIDGLGRIDRLPLTGEISSARGTIPVVGLNQYAVPVGGIAIFTPDWGVDRSQTLCGSDVDARAPCAPDRWEVAVRGGVVTGAGPPDGRPLAPDEIVLDGREQGAAALRAFGIGDPVDVEYELVPASGVAPRAAVGGQPILVDGRPTERLDDRIRAPRSAAGNSPDGHHLFLVTVDGRQNDSIGATLSEMSALLAQMGVDDAVNLDGGGSSTLVYRAPGAATPTIVNDPSDSSARLVGNGLGVYTG
jgi:hypothetical protein